MLGYTNGSTTYNNLNLAKTGAGVLTLTGTNTYTGYTLVTGGTLALSATTNNVASSALLDVEAGATLSVGAVTGGLTDFSPPAGGFCDDLFFDSFLFALPI